MVRLLFIILGFLLFTCISCKTIKIFVPKGISRVEASGDYQAGIGRSDITMPPGHSMGGYGKELGKISRGWWNHLYATSNYFEDPSGTILIMVTTDLWSVSSGLTDQVIHYLHVDGDPRFQIARESIIITATHTHNSPGNISSSWGYNLASSAISGFDQKLWDFTARRIAESIKSSITNKKPADIKYNQVSVAGLSRNRSIKAFQHNPNDQQAEIVDRIPNPGDYYDNSIICYAYTDSVFQAIDPYLTTISIYEKSDDSLMGILCVFGLHPTVMGWANPLLSSDIYGVARNAIENYFASQNEKTIVSFFNGPEGDVSANWYRQNRTNTERIGYVLADEIISSYNDTTAGLGNSGIKVNLAYVDISDKEVLDTYGELACIAPEFHRTDKTPVVGKASLNGAEDGRTNGVTRDQECFYDESRTKKCKGVQGTKREIKISRLAGRAAPRFLPIGLYQLGNIRIVTMPGETTVALGERLKKASAPPVGGIALVLSLANEYVSYLTTPSEFMLQHYEGSFTLYGAATGLFFEHEVMGLIDTDHPQRVNEYYGIKKYKVGRSIDREALSIKMRNKFYTGRIAFFLLHTVLV